MNTIPTEQVVAAAATASKRPAETDPSISPRAPIRKKPRDERLRECFEITPLEGGGEKVSCKYCPDYQKTLRSKFNPTKSREHLTVHCPGVDDELKKLLLETSQKAKKEIKMSELMLAEAAVKSEGDDLGADHHHHALLLAKSKKARGKTRKSPAYLSFHSGDSNLDVTAPMENGVLLIRISFPDQFKLNFVAEDNTEGAALCVEGFMNVNPLAPWSASLCSMTVEGTRAGPHCQWSLNPETFEEQMTRVKKVEQLMKVLLTK